ncbi:transglycosylase SLT domain-containing protein [Streptococcus dentasini]
MPKRRTNKTKLSDRLVIFTILTTFAALVLGLISENSKFSLSESSFAEEVSPSANDGDEDKKAPADTQPAEIAASTATAPTAASQPQEETLANQQRPAAADQAQSASSNTPAVATSTANTNGARGLANGNTAGAVGSDAAAQMAAATGVSQATWEYIIARESNGNPYVSNGSGASGLFQTMPGWGSTATVQDQVNAAINAYNAQGMSAWGM